MGILDSIRNLLSRRSKKNAGKGKRPPNPAKVGANWKKDGLMAKGTAAYKNGEMAKARELYLKVIERGQNTIPAEQQLLDASLKKFPARRHLARWLNDNMPAIKAIADAIPVDTTAEPKTYVFWAQGFENAPDVVQKCNNLLRKTQKPDHLVILDESNWRNYCTIPEDVIEKLSGQRRQFFADVLRIYLLAERGGVWIDATCVPTIDMADHVAEKAASGFFALTRIKDMNLISNWFMMAKPGSYIVRMMAAAMTQYWRTHNTTVDYLVFHLIFECLFYMDSEFHATWKKTPYVSAGNAHAILLMMLDSYDEEKFWRQIDATFIHKLTYKAPWDEDDKARLFQALDRFEERYS